MEDVTLRRRGHDGQTTETTEAGGGVFRPLPEKGIATPVWFYGPTKQAVLFSCPVSAIPEEVFALYALWTACRLTASLPLAGGLLDQPTSVQSAFPFFVDEWRRTSRGPE